MQKVEFNDSNLSQVIKRKRKTEFVEIFRTTPAETVCPNFYVLSHANGCNFSPLCTYCYLKSSFWYLSKPQVFINTEDMLDEVRNWIGKDNLESYMLNTGNLSDSLGFERHRPIVKQLVELFRSEAEAKGHKHTLLLVTKGGIEECQNLMQSQPCNNVIVSFSVNSPQAAEIYEKGAAQVKERIEAAKRLKSSGWRVRIRIDPMIFGYDYNWILKQVAQLEPERVTLGTLRAEHGLPRFVDEGLFMDMEQPKDAAGLARYPKSTRLSLYRSAVEELRNIVSIGLCEETIDVWEEMGLNTEAKQCNCCI